MLLDSLTREPSAHYRVAVVADTLTAHLRGEERMDDRQERAPALPEWRNSAPAKRMRESVGMRQDLVLG